MNLTMPRLLSAYNWYVKFHLKKIPEGSSQANIFENTVSQLH